MFCEGVSFPQDIISIQFHCNETVEDRPLRSKFLAFRTNRQNLWRLKYLHNLDVMSQVPYLARKAW